MKYNKISENHMVDQINIINLLKHNSIVIPFQLLSSMLAYFSKNMRKPQKRVNL